MKRPPRRYVGLRFSPTSASRREVQAALDAAWRKHGAAGAPPRLLVCQAGAAVVVVPRGEERVARAALGASGGAVLFTPVVTSGTIATVKLRLQIKPERR